MGLFSFLSRKPKERSDGGKERENFADLSTVRIDSVRMAFFKGNYEAIVEADKQNLETKAEYEMVTSYLSDIQKIEMIKEPDRAKLTDTVQKVINLHYDSKQYQTNGPKISPLHRTAIEANLSKFPEEVKKMEEAEKFQKLLQHDLTQLENEKKSIAYEIADGENREDNLKKIIVASIALMAVLAILLTLVKEKLMIDSTVILLGMFIAGVVLVWYLLVDSKRNRVSYKKNIAKMNRAITLLNKTKIKYVNCTNALDYSYDKYRVNNAEELAYQWDKYQKVREDEKMLSQTAELISVYEKDVLKQLAMAEVGDCIIWLSQLEALVDENEMVEVRHRLNVRRQKLRSRVDFNNEQKLKAQRAIAGVVSKYPEYLDEAKAMGKLYNIEMLSEA